MNLADDLTRHAVERPDLAAIIDGDRVIDYCALDDLIWRLAAWLRSNGRIGPGDIVGLSIDSPLVHLVAAFALARLGAVQITLPLRDPSAARESLAMRFGVRAIVADNAAARLGGLAPIMVVLDGAILQSQARDDALRAEGGEAVWTIAPSSGTTGSPKAIAVTHVMEDQRARRDHAVFGYRIGERYINLVDPSFMVGKRRSMQCLREGGTVVIPAWLSNAAQIIDLIDRHMVSYLSCTPSHLGPLLQQLPEERLRFPGLRVLRVGASVVPGELRRETRRRMTPNLFINYGTNDAGTLAAADPAALDRYPDTIGRPLPGVEIEIVGDNDICVPAGEIGPIRARGPGFASAYLDNVEASARAFRGGWFYPGDLGVLSADGFLFFKGRADDLMNFDGIKIAPVDIEDTLLQHPAVAEAAAFPLPSKRHQDVPAAAVVAREAVSAEALIAFCRTRLGARAPTRVYLVDALPKNAMGKVLKRALGERLSRER